MDGAVAGFGASRRGPVARAGEAEEDAGDDVAVRAGGGGRKIGKVSARSTTVLKESMNGSQAISDPVPPPAPIVTRIISAPIFNNVFPAYTLGSAWFCGGMPFW